MSPQGNYRYYFSIIEEYQVHTSTNAPTHTHTHTHVGFYGLRGLSIGVMFYTVHTVCAIGQHLPYT